MQCTISLILPRNNGMFFCLLHIADLSVNIVLNVYVHSRNASRSILYTWTNLQLSRP